MLPVQVLEEVRGTPFSAELFLDSRDPRAREPEVRDGQLGELRAVLERRLQRLPQRMPEDGHEPQLVDRLRGQHVRRREQVADVRRIEAAAEQCDLHGPETTSTSEPPEAARRGVAPWQGWGPRRLCRRGGAARPDVIWLTQNPRKRIRRQYSRKG